MNLDFGCGPGRDLKTLAGLGHTAIELVSGMAKLHERSIVGSPRQE